mmetsp:Transcript_5262/g.8075  ORF Transcript_5262/g.8075 Transcript_5262/m.8075 type:complete len:444 (-) Transcript_5262:1569-2900(-)
MSVSGEDMTLAAKVVDVEAPGGDEESVDEKTAWHWYGVILRVGIIGFFNNMVPSEPFLTKYIEEQKNVSDNDLNNIVWPTDTYANLAFLIPVALLAEFAGYRLTILIGFLARQVTRTLLLWASGVTMMSVMQGSYALQTACHTVFFAYALLVVPESYRAKSTAVVYALYHFGNVIGSALGQILVDYTSIDLKVLFYISWASQTFALLLFFLILPKRVRTGEPSLGMFLKQNGFSATIREIVDLYRTMEFSGIVWSCWWVCGYAGYYLFSNYYQMIIMDLNEDAKFGLIEIGIELAQTAGALLVAFSFNFMFARSGVSPSYFGRENILLLGLVAFIIGFDVLSLLAKTSGLAAVGISARMLMFGIAQTLAQPLIARALSRPYFALVMGTNMFFALCLTTIATSIGVGNQWATSGYWIAEIILSGSPFLFVPVLAGVFSCCSRRN